MHTTAFWLLTYLLHSSVLLGAAALLRLALGERQLSLQEAALRAAVVGGFLTASLQLGLGVRPLGGSVAVPAERPLLVSSSVMPPAPSRLDGSAWPAPARTDGATPSPAPVVVASRQRLVGGGVDVLRAAHAVRPHARRLVDQAAPAWRPLLAVAWGALGLVALSRFAVAAVRLRRLLRDRYPLSEEDVGPQAWAVAGALGLGRRVRLSTAPRLVVPLATGVLRPEVCLPLRVLDELAGEERLALCAHELAHVARRDPAWILLARLVEVLAPLQPLNFWARRRLHDLAECLSDDLAVAVSGRPLGLARSLVDVASWTLAKTAVQPVLAAGALAARSRVGHRVERLMDPLRALERPPRMLLPLAVVAVLASALVTPVVSGGAAQEAETPAATPQPTPQATPREAPQPAPHPTPRGAQGGVSRVDRESEARRQLESVTEQIAERSRGHEAELKELEAEIDALASKMKPDEQELERLSREIAQAADEMAELATAGRTEGRENEAAAEKMAAVRRQMAELTAEVKANVQGFRLPEDELRQLREKARALAALAKPTEEERRALRHAARDLARESMPDREEIARMAREAVAEARAAADQARQEARHAREDAQRAAAELKKALKEQRRAEEQAHPVQESEKP
jgi:beta-lactamase regulating signal transducer with metallopeptidase domain